MELTESEVKGLLCRRAVLQKRKINIPVPTSPAYTSDHKRARGSSLAPMEAAPAAALLASMKTENPLEETQDSPLKTVENTLDETQDSPLDAEEDLVGTTNDEGYMKEDDEGSMKKADEGSMKKADEVSKKKEDSPQPGPSGLQSSSKDPMLDQCPWIWPKASAPTADQLASLLDQPISHSPLSLNQLLDEALDEETLLAPDENNEWEIKVGETELEYKERIARKLKGMTEGMTDLQFPLSS